MQKTNPTNLRRATVLLAVLICAALASCAAEPVRLAPYRVVWPGEVLFERRARRTELRALASDRRLEWCGPREADWPSHQAVTRIRTPPDDAPDSTDVRSEPFAWTIMTAAAAAFGLNDPSASEAVIGNLRRWAKGEALTKLEDRFDDDTYYALERTLLPSIIAYWLVRPDPALANDKRALIERWLHRLVRLRGIKRPEESRGNVSRLNNHRYLSGTVDMAWGALRGNDEFFRKGIEVFILALEQMRDDGSLPLETARGARALYYQRHAIASLVAIAEMAAVQGYDLYSLEVNGRSLHDAIRYLADAVSNPELVWPYALAEVRPGVSDGYRAQDLTFLAPRGHGRHYMAWLEAYRARFPDREATARLWRQVREFDPEPRPMIDEYSGGNTTCLFARVP